MSNTQIAQTDYRYGFSKPENYVFKSKRGLSREVVEQISEMKNEPEWMREKRIKALEIFEGKKMPMWGADLSTIDFDNIYYYIRPTDRQVKSWKDLPKEILDQCYTIIYLPSKGKYYNQGIKKVIYKTTYLESTADIKYVYLEVSPSYFK